MRIYIRWNCRPWRRVRLPRSSSIRSLSMHQRPSQPQSSKEILSLSSSQQRRTSCRHIKLFRNAPKLGMCAVRQIRRSCVLTNICRSQSPKVISFSTPEELSTFAPSSANAKGSRIGAVISYGPFEDLPATTGTNFQRENQQTLTVHYEYETPIVTVVSMDRWAEISHWGNNLNIQDDLYIRNDGPECVPHRLLLLD
jgi:hypothetical protein